METYRETRLIKQTCEADLLRREGVTGVDIGYKYVGGKKTDELSIRVFVESKKDVPEKRRIPNTIHGVKTDVIQRRFILHPLRHAVSDLELKADTRTYNPLMGGVSAGPSRSIWLEPPDVDTAGWYFTGGTLGTIVWDNASGNPMGLSSFHVLCVDDKWSVGDAIAQPSRFDGGRCHADVVGELQRASVGGQVDCGVFSITRRGHGQNIVDIGGITGTTTATLGMAVRKRGRTTGLTYGTVDTVDLTVIIPYGNGLGTVTLSEQIGIEVDLSQSPRFSDNGDSGSVVMNEANQLVGLYFAGADDGSYGVANPIQAVLEALDVRSIWTIPKVKEEIEVKYIKEKDSKDAKDFREGGGDFKEGEKSYKEKLKEVHELYSTYFLPSQAGSGASLEERMSRLESAVAQFTHFIRPEFRPELRTSALSREPDISSTDPIRLSQHLQKQAVDAKQAKDNKDIEKLGEQ